MEKRFQSTLPTRGSDALALVQIIHLFVFQSTLPTRGSDNSILRALGITTIISIHAPHEGERPAVTTYNFVSPSSFQSTLPTRGSDVFQINLVHNVCKFQSTLPTRGSDILVLINQVRDKIFQSTLPTRGSDTAHIYPILQNGISIHAPHEGERPDSAYVVNAVQQFQSTLPTRGSDTTVRPTIAIRINFNPRSPRGGATLTC